MADRDRGAKPPDARRATVDDRSRERYSRARSLQRWRSDAVLTLRWTAAITAVGTLGLWWGIHRRVLPPWPFGVFVSVTFIAIAVVLLFFAVYTTRHRNDVRDYTLPIPYPPRCTHCDDDIFIGTGWTESGAQAGDVLEPEEDVLEPNVYILGRGMQNSVLASGMPGSGKTVGIVQKVLAQAIRKYPSPPPLVRGLDGAWRAIPAWGSDAWIRLWVYSTKWRARLENGRLRAWMDRRHGGALVIDAALDPLVGAAYGGIETEADAQLRQAALDVKHTTMRPVLLVFNPKAEEKKDSLAEFVRAHAAADSAERLAQVCVISPEHGTSIAMFDLRRESADLGDSIKRAIDIIDGAGDNFWAQSATALLTYIIAVLRAARPGRVNWHEVLRICGSQGEAQALVQEGLALQEEQLVAEREGKAFTRPRLDHNALLSLSKALDTKPEEWSKVTARVLGLGRYILGGDLRRVLAPEVATYGTWEGVFETGGIVVVDLPVSRWGSVSRASSVLLLNAFMSAATDYGARTNASERRRSFVILDEAHLFLSPELERATSMARAADLCFVFGVQTFAQLDAGGKTMRQTFLSNVGNKLSFRESDGLAARQIAGVHGTREEWVADETMSESLSHVEEGIARIGFAQSVNQAANERRQRKEVLRFAPEVLMGLPTGECIAQLTDGNSLEPTRRLRTPRCQDVDWLRITQDAPAQGLPPIPLLDVRGSVPDAVAFDALNFLKMQEDPEREPLLAAHVLRAERLGPPTGLVLWTTKFGFVLDRDAIPLARHILAKAFKSPMRTDTALTLPAPYMIVADIPSAHELQRLLQLGFTRPLPIAEANRELGVVDREMAALPADPRAFLGLRGGDWLAISALLHTVIGAGRDLVTALRGMEKGQRVLLEDEWRDALASSRPDAPTGDAADASDDAPATPDGGPSAGPRVTVPSHEHFLRLLSEQGMTGTSATSGPAAEPPSHPTASADSRVPPVRTDRKPAHETTADNAASPAPACGSVDEGKPHMVERGTDDSAGAGARDLVDSVPGPDGAPVPGAALKPGARARVGKISWVGRKSGGS
jgi:hypothetical protein